MASISDAKILSLISRGKSSSKKLRRGGSGEMDRCTGSKMEPEATATVEDASGDVWRCGWRRSVLLVAAPLVRTVEDGSSAFEVPFSVVEACSMRPKRLCTRDGCGLDAVKSEVLVGVFVPSVWRLFFPLRKRIKLDVKEERAFDAPVRKDEERLLASSEGTSSPSSC